MPLDRKDYSTAHIVRKPAGGGFGKSSEIPAGKSRGEQACRDPADQDIGLKGFRLPKHGMRSGMRTVMKESVCVNIYKTKDPRVCGVKRRERNEIRSSGERSCPRPPHFWIRPTLSLDLLGEVVGAAVGGEAQVAAGQVAVGEAVGLQVALEKDIAGAGVGRDRDELGVGRRGAAVGQVDVHIHAGGHVDVAGAEGLVVQQGQGRLGAEADDALIALVAGRVGRRRERQKRSHRSDRENRDLHFDLHVKGSVTSRS